MSKTRQLAALGTDSFNGKLKRDAELAKRLRIFGSVGIIGIVISEVGISIALYSFIGWVLASVDICLAIRELELPGLLIDTHYWPRWIIVANDAVFCGPTVSI